MEKYRSYGKIGYTREYWILFSFTLGVFILVNILLVLGLGISVTKPIITGFSGTPLLVIVVIWLVYLTYSAKDINAPKDPLQAKKAILGPKPTMVEPGELAAMMYLWRPICELSPGWQPLLAGPMWIVKADASIQYSEEISIKVTHLGLGGDQSNPLNNQLTALWKVRCVYLLKEGYFINYLRYFRNDPEKMKEFITFSIESKLKGRSERKSFAESAFLKNRIEKGVADDMRVTIREPIEALMEKHRYSKKDCYGITINSILITDVDPGPEVDQALTEAVRALLEKNARMVLAEATRIELEQEGEGKGHAILQALLAKGKGLADIEKRLKIKEGGLSLWLQALTETFEGANMNIYHLPFLEKLLNSVGKGFLGSMGLGSKN